MSKRDALVVVSTTGRITQLSGQTDSKSAKVKAGNTSPIKHMIFSALSNVARLNDDQYWEDVFLSAAKNNFPRGFRFDGKTLFYKIKNKALSLDMFPINDVPIENKYLPTKQFISVNSGLVSTKDATLMQDALPPISAPNEITWKDVKSPQLQIMYLHVFCYDKGKEFNFTEDMIECMFQSIISTVFTKDIGSMDIKMHSGKISSIDDIYVDQNGYEIRRQPTIKRESTKTNDILSTTYFQIPKTHTFACSKSLSTCEKKYN